MYVPDINFWLALTFSSQPRSLSAKAWFDARPEGTTCYFCRYTHMGFLRLSSNPKVNPSQTRTLSQAWLAYTAILADPRIGYAEEPPGLEHHWRQLTQLPSFSPHLWSDAYLAAFAIASGADVVTFDRGFPQFPGLRCTILS